MSYDYRAQAYLMAGPGHESEVAAVAGALHYNESLHMHDLGDEWKQHGACGYCWLRAGRAVSALVASNLSTAELDGVTAEDATP